MTPASGASSVPVNAVVTATFSEPMQQTMTAVLLDSANNEVHATVTYDTATRTLTLDPDTNLTKSATYTVTISGGKDAAGNVMAPLTWSFTAIAPVFAASVWPGTATPATESTADAQAIEVGVKFVSSVDGYITGLRFYKGAGNTGTHVGHLWDSVGNLLATVTFSSESATGWQQATFSAPVSVVAGQTYVASYYAPVGRYSSNTNYFTGSGLTNGPLTATGGVYRYGAGGGFPTSSYKNSNYWVDVVFATDLA